MFFMYIKEDDDTIIARAALREKRMGPYPLTITNEHFTKQITTVCGSPDCDAYVTLKAEDWLVKPLNEFKFKCPQCEEHTYESTITYNLN